MILELGLLCNVYIVYLLLRSYSTPSEVTQSLNGTLNSSKNVTQEKLVLPFKTEGEKDYHQTTRRISKGLISRITNQVLLSQQAYLSYWWMVTQQLASFNFNNVIINNNLLEGNQQELYLFDGLILQSNNSLQYIILINIFAFLSYQVCVNGLGSTVSIDGTFVNNSFNNINNNASGLLSGETSLIIQGNIIGIDLLLTSNNQIMALIAWELINICIYSQISVNNNKTKVLSNSIKYFIISAVSTTLFIQGITIIYMETGSFNLTNINYQVNMEFDNPILQQGTLFIYFTILLKLGGAPLHFWAPDLYSSQPSNITQWLLVVPKLGNLFLLLNLYSLFNFPYLNSNIVGVHEANIGTTFIVVIGIFSMQVGSISLLSQVKIKRFFAYSSICHVGFLLQCLSFNGFNSYIHYLIIYAQTTINIFIIIGLYNNNSLSFIQFTAPYLSSKSLLNKNNVFNKTTLSLFIVFSLNLFSLAGMPPLAGFYAKLGVQGSILSDAASNTHNIIAGILVILLFILASVISGYNYLRIIGLQLNVSGTESIFFLVNSLFKNKKEGKISPNNSINISESQEERNTSVKSQGNNYQYTIEGSNILFDILSIQTIVLILYTVL